MPNFYSTLRRFALTALLGGGGLLAAQAQTLPQPVNRAVNVAGTYTDLGTTGTVIATANQDDANSAAQNIGFSFGFNGAVFTQFVLNTNGVLRLGSAAPSTGALYIDPNTTVVGVDPIQSFSPADVNLIVPFNLDLIPGSGGATEYRVATTGAAGNRICTIQWKNVADKAGTVAGTAQQFSNFSFQVKLYEGPGTIEFVYDAATASAAAANMRNANVGLKGSGVATGQLLLATKASTVAWSAATFQNVGYSQNTFDVDKSALPTAGRTYRFVDPTYCLPIPYAAYPYTQNFDGVTAPAVPCGFTTFDANGDNNTWATFNSSTYASSAPNAMRYNGNAAMANDWFFTTPLAMTAGMSYQLQFKYRSYSTSTTQSLEVKVGNAATVAGQTTTVFTNTSIKNATYATTNNTQVVLYTPTTSGTYYFGFHAMSSPSQMYLMVDDLQVTEVATPPCPQPTNITISNITSSGATVSFTPPAGGTTYSVIYGAPGFTPPGGTATAASSSTSVTIPGLSQNTPYDVYVQATCGTAGTSVYTGPISFTTACATTTTFPYSENFDGVTAPALPCGITVLDSNSDGSMWSNLNSTTLASSTPNVMRYTASTANAADDWFFTNGLAMTVGNSYQLQFKYRSGATTNLQGLEVKVGSAATAAGQTITVFSNTGFNNTTYATTNNAQVLLFTPTTSGTYFFGFHAISAANQSFMYVDDVQVTQTATPTCVNPSSPVVSGITSTSATVAFSGPINATGYSVIYGPAGFTPPGTNTPVTGTTSPITLTGLTQNTAYDLYVRTTCGTNGTSILTGPVSFRTACATVTNYPYLENFDDVTAPDLPCGITVIDVNNDGSTWKNVSNATTAASGTNAITYNWNGTNAADDWFFTKALQMRAGYSYQLEFKYRTSNSGGESMEVKIGNAATVAGQTTAIYSISNIVNTTYITTTGGPLAGQIPLFTPTTAGIYYFGFHATSPRNLWFIYLDDIKVTEVATPACVQPSTLTASSITDTGATIAFTGPANGASYTVLYGPRGFTPPAGATGTATGTTSPITLTGLTQNTNYDVYVQATCGGTAGSSFYTGPLSIQTACATTTVFPYQEPFDNVTAPALPCGITVINVNNDSGFWKTVSGTGVFSSSPNAMMYNWNGTNKADDWFFTNALRLEAGGTYQLQFKYRTSNSSGEAMEVKVGTAATVAGQTTTVFTNNNITNTAYITTTAGTAAGQVASFTPPTTGVYYFGFHATSAANQWNLYVDDVQVDAVSKAACPTPTNVVVSNITPTTATVSFTGPTALVTGGYTVIYGPAGFDPNTAGANNKQTGGSSPITISNLSPITSYDVYVMAACASSVNSFNSLKVSFTSACTTLAAFPYNETFDGVTAPALPCGITVVDANSDGNTWVNSNFNPSSGTNSMRYNPSNVNAADDWFFTRLLALKSNTRYQLSFKYRVFSYNYPEKMEVKIGTSADAASQTTTLFSNMGIINSAYTLTSAGTQVGQVIPFTPTADGVYSIGFHAMSIANQFDIYVDDISVTATTITATKNNVAPGFSAEASPVPFSDHLTLNLTALKAGPLQLTLHDAVGRVVRETSANVPVGASALAVPNAGTLPAGIYILTVRQGGNTQIIRVAHE